MNAQLRQLIIAYAVTAAAMLAGLLLMRADARAYWRWPVYAAMGLALGVVTWSVVRKFLVPAQWALLHPGVLYYGALALYGFLGIALGVLLGRLTRRKTFPEDDTKEDTMDIPGPRPPPDE